MRSSCAATCSLNRARRATLALCLQPPAETDALLDFETSWSGGAEPATSPVGDVTTTGALCDKTKGHDKVGQAEGTAGGRFPLVHRQEVDRSYCWKTSEPVSSIFHRFWNSLSKRNETFRYKVRKVRLRQKTNPQHDPKTSAGLFFHSAGPHTQQQTSDISGAAHRVTCQQGELQRPDVTFTTLGRGGV